MRPSVVSCWQIMTGLAIDNRADAVDYLFRSGPRPSLSTGELVALLEAFPNFRALHAHGSAYCAAIGRTSSGARTGPARPAGRSSAT